MEPVNRMRRTLTVTLAFLILVLVPLGSAHVWNFENKGELCGVAPSEYAPQGHSETDGHAHWHHTAAAAAAHNHWNPATQVSDLYPAGHTHSAVVHDPCLQTRMDYPNYFAIAEVPLPEVGPPTEAIDPLATLYSSPDPRHSRVYAGGEAYEFPIPVSAWRRQSSLVVSSDLQAAGMGFPGSGTRADPYIIEGYIITGNLIVKNTSKCFVLRNNVVVNRVIEGRPILDLPDVADLLSSTLNWTRNRLNDTVDTVDGTLTDNVNALRSAMAARTLVALDPFVPAWQDAIADIGTLRAAADAEKAQEDSDQAGRAAERAQWVADLADWNAQRDSWNQQAAQWQADWDTYSGQYFEVVQETEFLAGDFRDYASQYATVTEPAKVHATYVDYANQRISNLGAIDAAFEDYQQDAGQVTNDNVEGWVFANPPPTTPPSTWTGTAQSWQYEVQNYQNYQTAIVDLIDIYWSWLQANAPDQAAYDDFVADKAVFDAGYADFLADYNAYMAAYNQAYAAYQAFLADYNTLYSSTQAILTEANAAIATANTSDFRYNGVRGTKLFNTLNELLTWAINRILGIVNGLDINTPAQNTGQLTLDWNGQCVHAYNNVAYDLRVNQNNDRTGFATGGIIEKNRFYTIGQIRHYDGIFRNNEVGNRAFLHQMVNPAVVPLAGSARAINNDGANQGWYYDNVIYGNVDLDFHGHHHSAGFFSPQSHYHGSTRNIVEMVNANGSCMATAASIDPNKHTGPDHDYPEDSGIDAFGIAVTTTPADTGCLDHFDHGKRWTSVFFNDNIVIDPNGVGLRFEDRDHRQDDEKANSENVLELKKPHYHQKWVQLEGNTVVGKIYVDVLNAAGTNLWNDNWAAVQSSSGPARTQEALGHPGAEIVNSHPYRNDAWLDIQGNDIVQTQSVGVLVADAADMELFQFKDNRGFGFPRNYQTTQTPAQFLQWLKDLDSKSTTQAWSEVQALGGQDRGVQTFAQLSFLRNGYTVQHCNNVARGLDRGFVATDRIYDDGASIIQACGTSDYAGANPQVDIAYTPAPATPVRCTENLREFTDDTDDFYVTEYGFDVTDPYPPATVCQELDPPMPAPGPQTVSDPVGYAQNVQASTTQYATSKLGI